PRITSSPTAPRKPDQTPRARPEVRRGAAETWRSRRLEVDLEPHRRHAARALAVLVRERPGLIIQIVGVGTTPGLAAPARRIEREGQAEDPGEREARAVVPVDQSLSV